jgi:hypothetical protein
VNQGCRAESICGVFGPACDQFESLIFELHSERTALMEHGQMETLISDMGTELLRRLMQASFDLCALREPRRHDLSGPDGNLLTHCRENCERNLATIYGEVTVKRKGYSIPGVESQFPLDGQLNLPKDKYSHGLRLRTAEEAALNSFDEVVANTRKTTGGKVPKRQAEEVAVAVAQDFQAFYSSQETEEAEQASKVLAMSTDGKGIVMRKEDLRPATRKAAEQEVHTTGTRLQPGEKPNRKRMATVAAVYNIEPHERTAEEIMGLCSKEERSIRPRPTDKRVWASVEQEPEDVIGAMFEEAFRRDPNRIRPWVILVDGGEQQLEIILAYIKRYRPDVTLILDFIHVLEYVWKAAYGLLTMGSQEVQAWVAEQALRILKGEAAAVAVDMRRKATRQQLSQKQRKPVDKCANYLMKYLPMLEYDVYLSEGLPIATGVIEGACRHLIKDRMDLTGARWRLKSAEAVLRIRSLRSSRDFEEYWAFHRAQEYQRNHCSHTGVACA